LSGRFQEPAALSPAGSTGAINDLQGHGYYGFAILHLVESGRLRMSKLTGTGADDLSAEVPEIDPNELVVKSKIGGGQFGDVFLGTCRGKTVAIKKLHAKQFEAKLLEEFRKEVAILTYVAFPP